MAAKKKRKRARKSSSTTAPKKRRRTKKRRAAASTAPKKRRRSSKRRAASNPAPKRRRRTKRRRASNPKKHKNWGAVAKHKRRVNPGRKKARRGKRRSRRNPGIPSWALVGLAAVGGLVAYAIPGAGSFALTQRLDPSMVTLERNRYIAGGVATAIGLGVGFFLSPVVGAGIAAGGLVGLAGTDLYLALGKVIDKKPEGAPPKAISAIYDGGRQRIQGVFRAGGDQRIEGMGGVFRVGEPSFARTG